MQHAISSRRLFSPAQIPGHTRLLPILIFLFAAPFLLAQPCSNTSGGIALTFDDAYIQEWHDIRSLLDTYDVRATFYISRYHQLNATQRQMVQDLFQDGHEIAAHGLDHANAASYCPGNTTGCTVTDSQRAQAYLDEQILPQLANFAADNLYPRNFAYPFGADFPQTTTMLKDVFGYVRDTSYYPSHSASYVAHGDDRFIAGLGIDHKYGLSDADYDAAMDTATCNNETLVWYGHRILYHSSDYYVGESRLEGLIQRALQRGLTFRRIRDISSWQATTPGGSWHNIHDTPRELDQVAFADFDGDGFRDAFRANGRTWEKLSGQGGHFYRPGGDERWEYLNTSGYRLSSLRFGDFDGNGRSDAFLSAGGTWYISYNGSGKWTRVQSSGYPLSRFAFADFDGDGCTDVFVSSGGKWYVSYNATSSWTLINHSNYAFSQLRFGDFNNDGRADVFVSSGGTWWVSYSGTGSWSYLNTSSAALSQLALADLNGDGRTDVFRATGAAWSVSYSGTGSWTGLGAAQETIADLKLVDLDGDGAAEIIRSAAKLP